MNKYLFLMHSFGGGAEKVALTLMQKLDRKCFAVQLGCLKHLPQLADEIPDDVSLLMPENPGLKATLGNYLRIRRAADSAHVVVGTLELQSLLAAALLAPGRSIGWLHKDLRGYLAGRSLLWSRAYKTLAAWSFKRCYTVACVGQGVLDASKAVFPGFAVPGDRSLLRVLWNPLNLDEVRRQAEAPFPEDLDVCFAKPVLLGVGRLAREKAFHVLVEAHARLLAEGVNHNLCIVGEGPERAFLESEARRLGVEDSTFLPGFKNPFPLMRRANVLALSSSFEGFGLVIVEALVFGLPVVSTDCPSGPREILGDNVYGTLVPVGDAAALARGIAPFLAANRTGDDASRKLRMRRAEDFGLEKTLAAWESLLEEAARGASR